MTLIEYLDVFELNCATMQIANQSGRALWSFKNYSMMPDSTKLRYQAFVLDIVMSAY